MASETEGFPCNKLPRPLLPAQENVFHDNNNSETDDSCQRTDSTPPDGSFTGVKLNKCHLCARSYGKSQSLGRHLREKHGGQYGIRRAAKHKCGQCEKRFQRPDGLRHHFDKVHGRRDLTTNHADNTMQNREADDETQDPADHKEGLSLPAEVCSAPQLSQSSVEDKPSRIVEGKPKSLPNAELLAMNGLDTTTPDLSSCVVPDEVENLPTVDFSTMNELDKTSTQPPDERTTLLARANQVVDDIEISSTDWASGTDDAQYFEPQSSWPYPEPRYDFPPTFTQLPYCSPDYYPPPSCSSPYSSSPYSPFPYPSSPYRPSQYLGSYPYFSPLYPEHSQHQQESYAWTDPLRPRLARGKVRRAMRFCLTCNSRQQLGYQICQPCLERWKTYCRIYGKRFHPPIPGAPTPLDLEVLIRRKERMRRFDRFMNYFRETHTQFQRDASEPPNPQLQTLMNEDIFKGLQSHREDFRRAFKDGLSATRRLLAGFMPSDLDAAIGIAEVASAMRKVTAEDNPATSMEDDFILDLPRLKIALSDTDQAVYVYYTSLLWGDVVIKDVAWQSSLDGDNLEYLQDLLSKLLLDSGFETVGKDISKDEAVLQSDLAGQALDEAEQSPEMTWDIPMSDVLSSPTREEVCKLNTALNPCSITVAQDSPMDLRFIMVAAGTIFGLVLTFVLLYYTNINVGDIWRNFIISRELSWDIFKRDYVDALWITIDGNALPNLTNMILALSACGTIGTVTSFQRELMLQSTLEQQLQNHGQDVMSNLQAAMESCGQRCRQWLRNTSCIMNCRLLELSLGLQSKPMNFTHGIAI